MGLTRERDNTCFSVIAGGKDCLKDNGQKFCEYALCWWPELELQVLMELDRVANSPSSTGHGPNLKGSLLHKNAFLSHEYFTFC